MPAENYIPLNCPSTYWHGRWKVWWDEILHPTHWFTTYQCQRASLACWQGENTCKCSQRANSRHASFEEQALKTYLQAVGQMLIILVDNKGIQKANTHHVKMLTYNLMLIPTALPVHVRCCETFTLLVKNDWPSESPNMSFSHPSPTHKHSGYRCLILPPPPPQQKALS